jgi:quercetin dioxygenase-like cupin family protein
MTLYDLRAEAIALPESWHSTVLGRIGTANLKVLRMDERSVIEEVHAYDEGLLVIDGRLELSVKGNKILLRPASFMSRKRVFLIR